jgi:hypothetical protein
MYLSPLPSSSLLAPSSSHTFLFSQSAMYESSPRRPTLAPRAAWRYTETCSLSPCAAWRCSLSHTHTLRRMEMGPVARWCMPSPLRSWICTRAHTNACIHTHPHTNAPTHTHAHTKAPTHTQARAQTQKHPSGPHLHHYLCTPRRRLAAASLSDTGAAHAPLSPLLAAAPLSRCSQPRLSPRCSQLRRHEVMPEGREWPRAAGPDAAVCLWRSWRQVLCGRRDLEGTPRWVSACVSLLVVA